MAFAADDFAIGPIIAKGKGLEIRRSQLDDAFIAFRANLAARGQTIAENKREGAEVQLLDERARPDHRQQTGGGFQLDA